MMKPEKIERLSKVALIHEIKSLRESRDRYSDLYDFAPVGCCTIDRQGLIQEINMTGAALLASPREELIGRPFESVPARMVPNSLESHLKRCAEQTTPVTSDFVLTLGQGVQRVIRIISDPATKEYESRVCYRTALIDITEEKRFGDELLLLSELGAVFVSPLDYTEALQAAARILVPALADLLKIDLLTEGERIERVLVLFADDHKQQALAERLKQFYPRPGWTTVQSKVIQSGQPILLADVSDMLRDRMAHDEVHASLLRATGIRSIMVVPLTVRGRTFGAMTFAAAESGRRYSASNFRLAETVASRVAATIDNARLFAEKKKAIAARDAILAVVSHDLKNSLNVIQLKSYVMSQSPEVRIRTDADFIKRRADEMARLIQDLLDISSMDAGQLRLEKSRQTVTVIVKKVMEAFDFKAQQKSLKLRSESSANELEVECDPYRVHQILANLIDNAIKFTAAGGTIVVNAFPGNGEVCLSVADSGAGIPEADISHVFDRFWTANQHGRGTGLGLSIAKGLVESQGGRIWAESQVGVGSTFFFTLPLAPADSKESAPEPRAA